MHAVRYCNDLTLEFRPKSVNINLDDTKDRQSFPFEEGEQSNVTKTLWFIVLRSGLTVTHECMDSI